MNTPVLTICYSYYMIIEKLGLGHKEVLTARLKALSVSLSEYSFPNLYLFRERHDYEVLLGVDIFVRGVAYDGRRYLMPTSDVRSVDPRVLKDALGGVDFLFPVPEEWLGSFPAEEYDVSFHEGDADYMYSVQKMSTYAGRKLHKKRNLLKQFTERYRHEAMPLTVERLDHARTVLEEWKKELGPSPVLTDYSSCREALDRSEELALCGGIVYADGEPAGFVLGEELNEETYVLHFAKARTQFKGVYQYLYNSFAKVLPPKYRFLNLEQDLDQENLRVFKSSYVPDLMLRKARVALKAA